LPFFKILEQGIWLLGWKILCLHPDKEGKIFLFHENHQIGSGANPATSSMGTQSPVYTCILDVCHTASPSQFP
jgi:hypothetical protein